MGATDEWLDGWPRARLGTHLTHVLTKRWGEGKALRVNSKNGLNAHLGLKDPPPNHDKSCRSDAGDIDRMDRVATPTGARTRVGDSRDGRESKISAAHPRKAPLPPADAADLGAPESAAA